LAGFCSSSATPFEHKQPEFFQDWRFLLVGVRWWWAKMRGKA
jgi:hypothetical protein